MCVTQQIMIQKVNYLIILSSKYEKYTGVSRIEKGNFILSPSRFFKVPT